MLAAQLPEPLRDSPIDSFGREGQEVRCGHISVQR